MSYAGARPVLAPSAATAGASCGMRSVKVAPSGDDLTAMEPPCSSTIFLTIARPRPVPPRLPEVTNDWNSFVCRHVADCFTLPSTRAMIREAKAAGTVPVVATVLPVVMFLADHGMPLPFSKTQLYHHSTHTPLVIRWPGVTKDGSVDERHMVSAVDFLPTMRPYCLALAAASFLYVAMADLIPGLHRGRTDAASLRQILLIGDGIGTMLIL